MKKPEDFKNVAVRPILRQVEVGEQVVFPLLRESAIRSAVCLLHRTFPGRFTVNKTPLGVVVTRIE